MGRFIGNEGFYLYTAAAIWKNISEGGPFVGLLALLRGRVPNREGAWMRIVELERIERN